jgi:hypothetical protein
MLIESGSWDELLSRPKSTLLRLFRARVRDLAAHESDDGLA